MAMTIAETIQVAQAQTATFNPAKGAVEPKGVDPGPSGPDVHPEDESSQVQWKDAPVNLSPSGNVSVSKLKLSPETPATTSPVPEEPPKAAQSETQPEEPKPAQQPSADARRFAALAREAKRNAAERRELQLMRQELDAELAEVRRFNQLKAKAPYDPLGAVEEGFGLKYDDLTAAALNGGKAAPETQVKAVKEELTGLKKSLAEEKRADIRNRMAQLKRQDDAAVLEFYQQIQGTIANNQEQYPHINFFGAGDKITELIYDNFKRTGQLIPVETALKFAEEQLTKYYNEKAPKHSNGAAPAPAPKPAGARSLSNNMTVSTRSQPVNGRKTDDQRLREAIAALSNQSR